MLALQARKHSGKAYELSEKFNIAESDILDFSLIKNPLGTPFDFPDIYIGPEQIVLRTGEKIHQYPDNRYLELRSAAAGFVGHGLTFENIVPGNGPCELLRLVIGSVVNEDDQVIVPAPSAGQYRHIAEIFGARVQGFSSEDLLRLPKMTLDRTKIVIVENPNDPTGALISRDEMCRIAEKCAEHDTLLIVDESSIELADPAASIADMVFGNDHLFVIRSVSNIIGMPGIRLGYGIASVPMSGVLNAARLSWNIGAFEEAVGIAFLGMPGGPYCKYLSDSRAFIEKEREFITERLSAIYGFDPIKSSANYILVDVRDLFLDSLRLTEGLASQGIIIRECSDFFDGQKRYVRISVRPRDEFERFLHSLDEVFARLSREDAREKLEETIEHGGATCAGRGSCEYYPCHFLGQDCTFCFCPFYACEDERTGGKWIASSTGGQVWSCEHCTLLHRPKVAKTVLDALMADGDTDENIRRAWKDIIEPLL
ncbi:aminotransferase class I/II-fold pyridoxal phosphate-dependent enzyme [Methanolobus sp. WCC5]|uniref:aminotransferase class I/II-fold pyridoxal phosphate-dependent enzyme n=1 Tax=Methanolobus sp. WCC5 TaxID=3125785 RepID=UPI0032509DFE